MFILLLLEKYLRCTSMERYYALRVYGFGILVNVRALRMEICVGSCVQYGCIH